MKKWYFSGAAAAGLGAGTVAGLFGAGGGMVLIPLLCALTPMDETELFPTSLSVMLPICAVTLAATAFVQKLPLSDSFPYLLGSAVGGILAGLLGQRIPTPLLHKGLGILILWGGIRNLW